MGMENLGFPHAHTWNANIAICLALSVPLPLLTTQISPQLMGTMASLLPCPAVHSERVHGQGWHLHTPILTIFFPSSLLALGKQKISIYSD